jgi:HSP20 family protein
MMNVRNSWLPEVFNDFFDNDNMLHTRATAPAVNVLESARQYTVQIAAPGLRKEDLQVSVNNDGDLHIQMAAHKNEKEEDAHYLRREFSYSQFEQTLILPDDVNRDAIAAHVADGILTVDLPKFVQESQQGGRNIEIG